MSTTDISVIIPTYKPQAYIEQCLKSLEDQTLGKSKFEIVLILNGSGEPYISYVQSVLKGFSSLNVNFLHTDTPGVSNARNIGLDLAKGAYITFIDDDDWVSESYLEEMLKIADVDTVVLSNVTQYDDYTKKYSGNYISKVFYKHREFVNISLLKVISYFSSPCCKLIPKNIIANRRFDTRISVGEDTLFMTLISDKFSKFRFTSANAVYVRRWRSDSAINRKRTLKDFLRSDSLILLEYMKLYLSNPFAYNFVFILARIVGVLRNMTNMTIRSFYTFIIKKTDDC